MILRVALRNKAYDYDTRRRLLLPASLLLVCWLLCCCQQHRNHSVIMISAFMVHPMTGGYSDHHNRCITFHQTLKQKQLPLKRIDVNYDRHNGIILSSSRPLSSSSLLTVSEPTETNRSASIIRSNNGNNHTATDTGYDHDKNHSHNNDVNHQPSPQSYDDHIPRSAFGTKEYWDDTYRGYGDFPAEEYSWYYGWDEIKRMIPSTILSNPKHIFIPGIGNDRLLIDLLQEGYRKITVSDYSSYAMERQYDLLQYYMNKQNDDTKIKVKYHHHHHPADYDHHSCNIHLVVGDVTKTLPSSWNQKYDMIMEKGLLDAIYLSSKDDSVVQHAVYQLSQCLQEHGILISISSVVPYELRTQRLFPCQNTTTTTTTQTTYYWEWLRDGTNDLKAGCFIFRKKRKVVDNEQSTLNE